MVDYAELKKSFKGDIVEPTSPDYAEAMKRWAANAQRKARYFAFPKDAADVSLVIKFATANAVPIAIKCGGHNPSGASSIENGLCIDLYRYLNTTRVDAEKKLAYVGGGADWLTVDTAVAKHGLGTPGGTVNHTGVAGLTLAGGYGWLSGEHGLVLDNLAQMTVVTADGSILTASETERPELFWGLRGGGSNFGVVTEFVMKLHEQRSTVFAGFIFFPPTMIGKLSEVIDEWYPTVGEKEALMFSLGRGPPPERAPAAFILLFYNGSEVEGRANFKRLFDLGPVHDTTREVPYNEVNSVVNPFVPHGRNYYMSGTSLRSKVQPQIQKVFDRMSAMTAVSPNPDAGLPPLDMMIGYELFPLQKVAKVSPDSMAFRSRGLQPNVVVLVSWDGDHEGQAGTPHAREYGREIVRMIESFEERELREDENDGYGNYVCDPLEMKDKRQKLWGDNYPRLQKLKKEYDPNLVFNRWFPIQPAA